MARARRARIDGSAAERATLLALLAASIALLVWGGIVEVPKVAHQVWSYVGVKHVEKHAALLRQISAESRMDANLLAGIMYVESRGDPAAVSSAGALGLFQVMPAVASDAAKRLRIPVPTRDELLSDPLLNGRIAANHLAWLYRNEGPDLERVLVAYNAGRGKMHGWLRDAGGWSAWRAKHVEAQDSQTLAYAQQVLDYADRFRRRGNLLATAPDSIVAEQPPAPAVAPKTVER